MIAGRRKSSSRSSPFSSRPVLMSWKNRSRLFSDIARNYNCIDNGKKATLSCRHGHLHHCACHHKSDWDCFRPCCSLRTIHREPHVWLDDALSCHHGGDLRNGLLLSVPWSHASHHSGYPFVDRPDAGDRGALCLSSRRVLALDLCRRSSRRPLLQC